NVATLRLFRGPEGTPLAEFHQPAAWRGFALSSDGRLLARQVRSSQVEVRDVVAGGPPLCITPRGRVHHDAALWLGDDWLTVQIDQTIHLVHWNARCLEFRLLRGDREQVLWPALEGAGLSRGIPLTPERLPSWVQHQAGRFRAAAWGRLIAAVDRFS